MNDEAPPTPDPALPGRPPHSPAPPSPHGPSDEFLVRYLRTHDAACPTCDYNLRFLTQPRCPECGQDLRLRVDLAVPYMRAWVALAVPVLGLAGIGGFFLTLFLTRAAVPRDFHQRLWIPVMFCWAMIPASVSVVVRRRAFMRCPEPVQWGLAAAVWIAAVAVFVTLIVQML